jgi:hypothetical protein
MSEETKMCKQCKEIKPLSEFYRDNGKKDGFRNKCKICNKQYRQQYCIDYPEKIKQYTIKNKEEKKSYDKKYKSKHKEKIKMRNRMHRLEHKEEIKLKSKQRYLKHQKEIKLQRQQHRLEHRNEMLILRRKYINHKNKTDPIFKIIKNVRSRNIYAFKSQGVKKTMHTLESLGCTALEFQTHMISNFKPGMTKENNGKRKWQQHHIIPFSSVDLKDPEQLKKVCHYTNIIPMWEDEHREWHKTHQ